MTSKTKPENRAYPYTIAIGTPMGERGWMKFMELLADRVRSAFAGRPDAEKFESDFLALQSGLQWAGYWWGVADGYGAARRLLKDKGDTQAIVRIVRRHPNWKTKKICRAIDALNEPPELLWKSNSRLWQDALNDRNSRLTRSVEKYISRIRIAAQLISEARPIKSYVTTRRLPLKF